MPDFYKKYLKYKNKYNELKKLKAGALMSPFLSPPVDMRASSPRPIMSGLSRPIMSGLSRPIVSGLPRPIMLGLPGPIPYLFPTIVSINKPENKNKWLIIGKLNNDYEIKFKELINKLKDSATKEVLYKEGEAYVTLASGELTDSEKSNHSLNKLKKPFEIKFKEIGFNTSSNITIIYAQFERVGDFEFKTNVSLNLIKLRMPLIYLKNVPVTSPPTSGIVDTIISSAKDLLVSKTITTTTSIEIVSTELISLPEDISPIL